MSATRPPEAWERLAAAVTRRRTDLDMTQAAVQTAGGPAVKTLSLIENAGAEEYSPRTMRRLEDVLQWKRGSIEAILDGGEPAPLDPSASSPPPGPRLEVIEGEGLETDLEVFKAAVDRGDEPPVPPGGLRNPQEREIWAARSVSAWERWEVIEFLRNKERERTARVRELQAEMEAERRQSGPQR